MDSTALLARVQKAHSPSGLGAPARPERPPDLNPAHGCFPCIHGRDWGKRFPTESAMAAAGAIAQRRNGCHGRLRLTASFDRRP